MLGWIITTVLLAVLLVALVILVVRVARALGGKGRNTLGGE